MRTIPEGVVQLDDQIAFIIIISMALLAAVLLVVIILLWKKLRKGGGMVEKDPYRALNDLYYRDSDGNGIPDNIERMFMELDQNMKAGAPPKIIRSNSYSINFSSGEGSYGTIDRVVKGKRTHHTWGKVPEDKDAGSRKLFDSYISGAISAEEFKRELEIMKRSGDL